MSNRKCSSCDKQKVVGTCFRWDNELYQPAWHCKECCEELHDPEWKKLEEKQE